MRASSESGRQWSSSLSLLLAVGGPGGRSHFVRAAPRSAEIAQANVESWYGAKCLRGISMVGDAADALYEMEAESLDHVVLDMLAPWEIIASAAPRTAFGGRRDLHVTTTAQLSRFVESSATASVLRSRRLLKRCSAPGISMASQCGRTTRWSDIPASSLSLAALRGVLLRSLPKRRPAPAARPDVPEWENWDLADLPEREISAKKLRKVRRMWRIARM